MQGQAWPHASSCTSLASAGCELTAEARLLDALDRISVDLQRSRALVLQRGIQKLRLKQSVSAGGSRPIGGGAPQLASRRRQQRLFDEHCADGQLDLGHCFHASMRAGGGRTTTSRCQDPSLSSGALPKRTTALTRRHWIGLS